MLKLTKEDRPGSAAPETQMPITVEPLQQPGRLRRFECCGNCGSNIAGDKYGNTLVSERCCLCIEGNNYIEAPLCNIYSF